MVEPQLVEYIKKAKQINQADAKTRELLIKNGWYEAEINEAFASLNQASPPPVQQPQPQASPQPAQPQTTTQQPRAAAPKIVFNNAQAQPTSQPAQYNKPSVKPRGTSPVLKILSVFVVLILIGGVGFMGVWQFGLLDKLTSVFSVKDNEVVNIDNNIVETVRAEFSKYKLESTPFTASLPNTKIVLKDLTNTSNFEKSQGFTFSKAQKDSLVQNNFFIVRNFDKFYSTNLTEPGGRNDDWTELYRKIGGPGSAVERAPENSVFISADLTLHVYHKLVENEFEYIEQNSFYPTLKGLSQTMFQNSAKQYNDATDPDQKESYERLSSYFLVASAILENASTDYNALKEVGFIGDSKTDTLENVTNLSQTLGKQAKVSDNARIEAARELSLIFDPSKGRVQDPIFGDYQPMMPEDYTQFTPRSHYAKNVILRDYFRVMMYFGRTNFLLSSAELTRDAANIQMMMPGNTVKSWESIYLPTTFFVGQSDDLSIYDLGQAIKKVGFDIPKLQTELKTYKNPQILSSVVAGSSVVDTTKEDLLNSTKGFRFMGQRFTPDAFIFSSLTQGDEKPDPKTGQSLPSTPTALMVSTLMGSKTSGQYLTTWVKNNAPKSDKVLVDKMNDLNIYFGKVTPQQWTQNIYWSWLYTIKSLFTDDLDKTNYPGFVKSPLWETKNLQSFLGSWTELKHDTLLYAKQSYAEMGAGGPGEEAIPAVPKGYVEPNIQFYDRLIALVNLTTDGLKNFDLLPENLSAKNDSFIESLNLYRRLAVSELQNEKINDEDFEKLRLSAGNLSYVLSPANGSEIMTENGARSALIADVHTDVVKSQILYEADGIPNYIYVAVADANGTRLTKGLVYSYYEFTDKLTKRLTDQDWQKYNYSNTIKKLQMPFWTKSLVK